MDHGSEPKVGYLYADLGSLDISATTDAGIDYAIRARFAEHIARVGFNYKLGAPN